MQHYNFNQSDHPEKVYSSVIFDLDGVISNTASIHARAWKLVFDLMLKRLGESLPKFKKFIPFDIENDYLNYVDGKSRLDGIRSFLESRLVALPEGSPNDLSFDTINGLSSVKNEFYQNLLELMDDIIYSDSIKLIDILYHNKIPIGVASSSQNCQLILHKSGLYNKFDHVIGGKDLVLNLLQSKPSPDIYQHVFDKLGIPPNDCIVIEDAVSGVIAAKKANAGLVIGLERNSTRHLANFGADFTVNSLDQLKLTFKENGQITCSIKIN